jgi:hypothetical protein
MMDGSLLDLDDAIAEVRSGRPLLVAGDEKLLAQLPDGTWIGGTIPYFMTHEGGTMSQDRLFIQRLPESLASVTVKTYTTQTLDQIPGDGFDDGFSVVILPGLTSAHQRYAFEASTFPGLFDHPIVGWVSGVHVDDVDMVAPRVFAGATSLTDGAVVIHARLKDSFHAMANILNLFCLREGPSLTFPEAGFSPRTVLVDGEPRSFAEHLRAVGHDIRLPLVRDYFGASANIGFRAVPDDDGPVELWVPVQAGTTYRLASPIGDYVTEFNEQMPLDARPVVSFNCLKNYLHGELEGRRTGDVVGPITFGEIAYELVNQTLVYLTIAQDDGSTSGTRFPDFTPRR